MNEECHSLQKSLLHLSEELFHLIFDLRDPVLQQLEPLTEYISPDETPQKTEFSYPKKPPPTASHKPHSANIIACPMVDGILHEKTVDQPWGKEPHISGQENRDRIWSPFTKWKSYTN
jgi:hypothetical protein